MTEQHISLLLNCGLLTRHLTQKDTYWFALAGIGPLIKSLIKGRKVSKLPVCPHTLRDTTALWGGVIGFIEFQMFVILCAPIKAHAATLLVSHGDPQCFWLQTEVMCAGLAGHALQAQISRDVCERARAEETRAKLA